MGTLLYRWGRRKDIIQWEKSFIRRDLCFRRVIPVILVAFYRYYVMYIYI